MDESSKNEGSTPLAQTIHEHIVEIVSDSGEGAQKCGQSFAILSAKMGNGVWTVEIIPAETDDLTSFISDLLHRIKL